MTRRRFASAARSAGSGTPTVTHLEGCNRLTELLAATEGAPEELRARPLYALGVLVDQRGEPERAAELVERSLTIFREQGDRERVAAALNSLGSIKRALGDLDAARSLLEEGLAIRRELGDEARAASSLGNLGILAFERGDLDDAESRFLEALELDRMHGNEWGACTGLDSLVAVAIERGDHERARELDREMLASAQRVQDQELIAFGLEKAAILAAAENEAARAGRLAGAADAVREAAGSTAATSIAAGSIVTSARSPATSSRPVAPQGRRSSPKKRFAKLWRAEVMSDVFLFLGAFAASAVEMVEALTIVLAVGVTRGWRSPLIGVAAATVALVAIIAALGPALQLLPIDVLRLVVGALLLCFGLQWLRKAILRSSGYKPLHDEEEAFLAERAEAAAAGRDERIGIDWYGFTIAFKGVLLEGLEVAFIVITFGSTQGRLGLAAAAAGAALVLVATVGVLVHAPLSRVPENTIKFAVGLLLTTFGTFWAAEGAGVSWPGDELALLGLLGFLAALAFLLVELLRRQRLSLQPGEA